MAALPLSGLQAADDNTEPDPPVTATTQTLDVDAVDSEDSSGENSTEPLADTAEASDENFVPSIRITEDLPVAFPVDI